VSSTPLALARDAPLSPISLSAASPWALALTALDRKKGGPVAALLPACLRANARKSLRPGNDQSLPRADLFGRWTSESAQRWRHGPWMQSAGKASIS
jgi:hypothetical protein